MGGVVRIVGPGVEAESGGTSSEATGLVKRRPYNFRRVDASDRDLIFSPRITRTDTDKDISIRGHL
jgi:hypothetical protein